MSDRKAAKNMFIILGSFKEEFGVRVNLKIFLQNF